MEAIFFSISIHILSFIDGVTDNSSTIRELHNQLSIYGENKPELVIKESPSYKTLRSIDTSKLFSSLDIHKEHTIYEIPTDGFGVLDLKKLEILNIKNPKFKYISYSLAKEISGFLPGDTVEGVDRIIIITPKLIEEMKNWVQNIEDSVTFSIIDYFNDNWGNAMPKLPFSVLNLPGLPITDTNFINVSHAVYNHPESKKYFDNINVTYYTNRYTPRFELMGHGRDTHFRVQQENTLNDLKGMKVGIPRSALNFNLYKVIFEQLVNLGMIPIAFDGIKELISAYIQNSIQAVALPFSEGFKYTKISTMTSTDGWYTNNLYLGMSNSPIVIQNEAYIQLKNR